MVSSGWSQELRAELVSMKSDQDDKATDKATQTAKTWFGSSAVAAAAASSQSQSESLAEREEHADERKAFFFDLGWLARFPQEERQRKAAKQQPTRNFAWISLNLPRSSFF